MGVKERYEGMQNILLACGETGCLFLSLLSIAEEFNEQPVDLIDAIRTCLDKGLIAKDFTCYNQERILEVLTGQRWRKSVARVLPDPVPDNMYTIAKYKKGIANIHFRRRGWDVYTNSKTVRDGKITEYYCYTVLPYTTE